MMASLKGSNYYSSLFSQFCQDYKANAKESTMMSNSLSLITFQSILVNRDLSNPCCHVGAFLDWLEFDKIVSEH